MNQLVDNEEIHIDTDTTTYTRDIQVRGIQNLLSYIYPYNYLKHTISSSQYDRSILYGTSVIKNIQYIYGELSDDAYSSIFSSTGIQLQEDDIFIDMGCGNGRALLLILLHQKLSTSLLNNQLFILQHTIQVNSTWNTSDQQHHENDDSNSSYSDNDDNHSNSVIAENHTSDSMMTSSTATASAGGKTSVYIYKKIHNRRIENIIMRAYT